MYCQNVIKIFRNTKCLWSVIEQSRFNQIKNKRTLFSSGYILRDNALRGFVDFYADC